MNRTSYWTRPALAVMVLLALGIAACTVPTSYEVGMGQKLSITLADKNVACDDLEPALREISGYLDGLPGVEQAGVAVRVMGGATTIDLMVWGQDLAAGDLAADLRARFPLLADAAIATEELAGTVRGSLAQAFGHAAFGLEIDAGTAEEARLQILQQLASQGFGGDAQVEVVDDADGRRTIRVELSDSCMVDEGGGKVVVEQK
ncbi:MAG: hypothetical protein Q7W56_13315 [Candidatus Latescibacteria bacterium]|nr:hypothetical protein [Candidatus Latescibacterota bacterium]